MAEDDVDDLFEEEIDDGGEEHSADGQGEQGGLEETAEAGERNTEVELPEDGEVGPDGVVPERQVQEPNSRERRSRNHYKELETERNRLREENARIAQERADLLARQQNDQALAARARQQQEQARREQMLPEERNAYDLEQIRAQLTYQDQMRVFERQDAQDAANYKATAKVNPLYARHEAAVEKSLAQLRASGQNMPREVLLRYHIGEEMLKTSQKNSKPQNPQRSRAVPKPNNSRADVSNRQGSKKPSSEKERIIKQWGETPL